MGDWIAFWDSDHRIYVSACHRDAHFRTLAEDLARYVPSPGATILDYGCGEALYADVFQGCHMTEGVGAVGAGTYPALARNPKLATAGYPLFLVIHGRKGMPPFGKLLTDQQVAAVVNYIRTHFGNDFPDAVSADDARAAR